MSEPIQLTTNQLYFRDPDVDPPPKNVNMLLLNPGGVLIVGQWSDDCLAWCPKPKIPTWEAARNTITRAKEQT